MEPAGRDHSNGAVAVIAGFDGMHRGHRALAAAGRRLAAQRRSACIAVVVEAEAEADMLVPIARRCELLLQSGMNAVVVIDSNRSSFLSPPELGTYLRDMLGVADVLLEHRCHDSTYDAWSPVLRSTDVGVTEVARALHQREPITSTRIKACLARGDVEEAGAMIDADVEFTGVVTRGAQLGRTLGFPTANLAHDPLVVWPSCGVYYGSVTTQGSGAFPAAINIGVRPTVEHAGRLLMEAHLLDFDGDLYDQNITVAFRQRLRDEQAFASLDALKAQLRLDVQSVARLSAHARR